MFSFDQLKSIGKILKDAGKIEQYSQILDAREKLLEMQNRMGQLESENSTLKEQLKITENLIYKNNAYWIIKNNEEDGPFCSRCWDKNKDLIRMTRTNESYSMCPECKNSSQTGRDPGPSISSVRNRYDYILTSYLLPKTG